MTEKRSGYALLTAGIMVMLFALIYILLVFTGRREPVQVLNVPAPKIDLGSLVAPGMSQMVGMPSAEIEIIPTDELNTMLNMTISLFLAGFVMSFGFKIASLGIMFVRTIEVKLKEEKPLPSQ